MKKFISIPGMLAIAAIMLVASCKKDKPAAATGADALTAGKAAISFTSSPNFVDASTFTSSNDASSTATQSTSGTTRSITLYAPVTTSSSLKTAEIGIEVSSTASTTSGNLTATFQTVGTVAAGIDLASVNTSGSNSSYTDLSGTLTITKLTATEIEGTFTGTVKDDTGSGSANLSLTGGSFAGKFN